MSISPLLYLKFVYCHNCWQKVTKSRLFWRRCNDRARRCERGEDPAVGCHWAGAPVAMEHRWLHSSACSHWHTRPDGAPSRASKTMFERSSLGLPSILFAYLRMCMLKPVTETGMLLPSLSIQLELRLHLCYRRTAKMGDSLWQVLDCHLP